jgi:hypothetical protein
MPDKGKGKVPVAVNLPLLKLGRERLEDVHWNLVHTQTGDSALDYRRSAPRDVKIGEIVIGGY